MNKTIHDELHKSIDIINKLRKHNLELPKILSRIISQHNSICLDNEEERQKLFEALVDGVVVHDLNDLINQPTKSLKNKYVDPFNLKLDD